MKTNNVLEVEKDIKVQLGLKIHYYNTQIELRNAHIVLTLKM